MRTTVQVEESKNKWLNFEEICNREGIYITRNEGEDYRIVVIKDCVYSDGYLRLCIYKNKNKVEKLRECYWKDKQFFPVSEKITITFSND